MVKFKLSGVAALSLLSGVLFAGFPARAETDCERAEAIVFSDNLSSRTNEALYAAEACRTVDPANGLWMKGIVQENMNKYEDAIATFDAMLALEPKFAGGWAERGGANYMLRRFDAAIADYSKAIALEQKADYYGGRANAYDDSGRYDAAMADYTRAIALDPNSGYVYRERSVAYFHAQNYQAAVDDASKAIQLDASNKRGYLLRGDAYWALDKRDLGYADYLKFVSMDQSNAKVYDRIGAHLYDLHDFDGAIVNYDKSLALNPDDAAVLVDRANAKDDKGDPSAMADYNRAIQLDAKYGRAYYDRGLAFQRLGKKDAAIADYTKAIALDPNDEAAKKALAKLTAQ